MTIECLDLKGINNDYLKAVARVKIPSLGIIVNDVKLFFKNDKYWVSMPSKEYKKDGEKKYFPVIQFLDKENGKKIEHEITQCIIKELQLGKQLHQSNREETSYSFDGF